MRGESTGRRGLSYTEAAAILASGGVLCPWLPRGGREGGREGSRPETSAESCPPLPPPPRRAALAWPIPPHPLPAGPKFNNSPAKPYSAHTTWLPRSPSLPNRKGADRHPPSADPIKSHLPSSGRKGRCPKAANEGKGNLRATDRMKGRRSACIYLPRSPPSNASST